MPRSILKGSTDVIEYIRIRDSITGIVETGFDVTTLDFQYTRNGEAPSTKQDVTALVATDSDHADNKAIEVDATSSPGLCRVDFPDAAFATGADGVILSITGAGFDPIHKEIQLVDYDPNDGIRLGLTALPNAVADAAGGLPISDAGGLDMDGLAMTGADGDTLETLSGQIDRVCTLGAGAITWPYTLTDSVAPYDPIADADVWVSSDLAGTVMLASGRTNANGVITFYLDPGQVFIWAQKTGWNFDNPDTETVS